MLGKIAERVDLLVMVYDRYNRSGLPWRCEAWRHEDGGWAKASSKDGERLLRAVAQALEKGLSKGENDLGEV